MHGARAWSALCLSNCSRHVSFSSSVAPSDSCVREGHARDRVAGTCAGDPPPPARGHRPPGRPGVPPGAHRRQLRAGDRPRRRPDRARRRRQPRRRPRRPARERALPGPRTSPPGPSSPTAAPPAWSDGKERTGWFAEDFTLAEIRTLRAIERMPELRPLNTAYDGQFGILTLAEVVELARTPLDPDDRPIRVLAELKKPSWSAEHGLPMAELVAAELRRLDATDAARARCAAVLRRRRCCASCARRSATTARRWSSSSTTPPTGDAHGHQRRAAGDLHLRAGRSRPSRHRILPATPTGCRSPARPPSSTRRTAPALSVVRWTLRAENAFLPRHLQVGDAPSALGDAAGEARLLLALGRRRPDHRLPRPRRPAVAELADCARPTAALPERSSRSSSATSGCAGPPDPDAISRSGRG